MDVRPDVYLQGDDWPRDPPPRVQLWTNAPLLPLVWNSGADDEEGEEVAANIDVQHWHAYPCALVDGMEYRVRALCIPALTGEFEYTVRALLPSGEMRWASSFGDNARITVGQPLLPRTIAWFPLLTYAEEPVSPCHVMHSGQCGELSVPEIRPWVVRRFAEGWASVVRLAVQHNVTVPAARGRPVSLPLAAYALALLSFELWVNRTPARVIRAVVGACLGLPSLPESVFVGSGSRGQARAAAAVEVGPHHPPASAEALPPLNSRHEISRIVRRLWGSILAGRVADTLASTRCFPAPRALRAISDWGHPWTAEPHQQPSSPPPSASSSSSPGSRFYPPLLSPNRASPSFTSTEAQEYALMALLDVAVQVPFGAIAADDEAGSDDRGGGGDPRGRATRRAHSRSRWSFSEALPGPEQRLLRHDSRSQSADNLALERSPSETRKLSSSLRSTATLSPDTVFFDLTLSLTKHGGPWLLSQPLLTAVVALLQTSENSMTRIHLLHLLHALYRPSVRSLTGWERWCRARSAVQQARMRGGIQRVDSRRSFGNMPTSPRAHSRSPAMSPRPAAPVRSSPRDRRRTSSPREGMSFGPSGSRPRISSPLRPRPPSRSPCSQGNGTPPCGDAAFAMDDFLAMWRSRVVSEVAQALIKRVRVTSLSIQYAVAHETRIPVQLLRQGPSLSGGILGGDEDEQDGEDAAETLAEDAGVVADKPKGSWRIPTSNPVDEWVRNCQRQSGDTGNQRPGTPPPGTQRGTRAGTCSIPPAPRIYSRRSSNNMGPASCLASGEGSIDASTGVLVRPHAGVTVGCIKELLAFCGQVVTGYRALQVQEDPSWRHSREGRRRNVEEGASKAAARHGGPDVAALSRSQLLSPLRTTFSAESEASVWKKRREHAWRRKRSSGSGSHDGNDTDDNNDDDNSNSQSSESVSGGKIVSPSDGRSDASAPRSASGSGSAGFHGEKTDRSRAEEAGIALPPVAVARARSYSSSSRSRSRSRSESGSESDGTVPKPGKSPAGTQQHEKSPLFPQGFSSMLQQVSVEQEKRGDRRGSQQQPQADVHPSKLQLEETSSGGEHGLDDSDFEPVVAETPSASDEEKATPSPEHRDTPGLLSLLGSTRAFGSVGPSKLVGAVGHCLVRLAPQVCGEYDHVLRCAASIAQADEGAARFLVHSVLQKWPHANSAKQVLLLKFLAASMPGWAFGPSELRRDLIGPEGARSRSRSRSLSVTDEESVFSGPSDTTSPRLLTCMTGPELLSLPRSQSLRQRLVHRVRKCLLSDHAQLATVAASLCHPFPAGMEPSPFSRLLRRDPAAASAILAALQSEAIQRHWNTTVRKNAAVVQDAISKLEVTRFLPSTPSREASLSSTDPSSAPSPYRPSLQSEGADVEGPPPDWHRVPSAHARGAVPHMALGGSEHHEVAAAKSGTATVSRSLSQAPPRPPERPVGHGGVRGRGQRRAAAGSVPGVHADARSRREEASLRKSGTRDTSETARRVKETSVRSDAEFEPEAESDEEFEPASKSEAGPQQTPHPEPNPNRQSREDEEQTAVNLVDEDAPATHWSREVRGAGDVTPAAPAVWTSPEHLYGRRPRSMTFHVVQTQNRMNPLWSIMSALHLDSPGFALSPGVRRYEHRHRRKHRQSFTFGKGDVEVDSSDSDHSGGSAPSRVSHPAPPLAVSSHHGQ